MIFLFLSLQGFNPMWEETLTFTVHMPEIALVRFLVWDHDPIGRDFVGQRTVTFSSLVPGGYGCPAPQTDHSFFLGRVKTWRAWQLMLSVCDTQHLAMIMCVLTCSMKWKACGVRYSVLLPPWESHPRFSERKLPLSHQATGTSTLKDWQKHPYLCTSPSMTSAERWGGKRLEATCSNMWSLFWLIA